MIIIAGRIVEVLPRYTAAEAPRETPQLTHVLRHIWLKEATKRLERFATTETEEAHILAEASRLQTIDILAAIGSTSNPNLLATMLELEATTIAVQPDSAEARRRVEAKLHASAALVASHKEEFS